MAYLIADKALVSVFALYLQANEGGGIPWWVWLTLISLLLLLLLIGFVRQSGPGEPLPKPEERAAAQATVAKAMAEEAAPEPAVEVEEIAEAAPPSEAEKPAVPEPEATDDLKRIEGIGPKISSILNENGITTFAALATSDPERLQEVLDEAGIRLAHPGTWPEQAKLAAAGQWDELEALQGASKGGRKS